MDAVSTIVSAVEIGSTIDLNEEQKEKYKSLIEILRQKLASDPDASFSLNRMLKRPDSKASSSLLKEELTRLRVDSDPEITSLSNHFLKVVEANFIDQQVINQKGNYNINIGGGIVIGDKFTDL